MKKRIFGLFCLLAMLTACTPKNPEEPANVPPEPTSPSVASPESPKQPDTPPEDPNAIHFFECGTLDLSNPSETVGRENFEEFLNVTGAGNAATIQITQPDKEGSPITSTLSFEDGTYTFKNAGSETTWKQLQIAEFTSSGQIHQTFRLTNVQDLPAETPDGKEAITLFEEIIES